jgi:hypothetical protein
MEEENNDTGISEEHAENKNLRKDAEQHTVGDKLKEELQIVWCKVRLLQMPER